MAANNTNYTKDYFDVLAFASCLSQKNQKEEMTGDEMFFGVYEFLKQFSFESFYWSFVGINNLKLLQQYYSKIFGEDINHENLQNTDVNIPEYIQSDLAKLSKEGIKEFDFLVAFYVSLSYLSDELRNYLIYNGVKVEKIQNKLESLIKNPSLAQVGAINLFKILSKTVNVSDLDVENLDMFVDIKKSNNGEKNQTKDTNSDLESSNDIDFDFDEIEASSDQDLKDDGDTSQINTDVSQDQQKLTIEYFGTDLTKETQDGYLDPVIGRDKEIQQTIYTLLRKTKNNPLLIGEAGVGKTAIVEGLAQRIIEGNVPEKLKNKRIFVLDMGSLLAGTKYRGEFEVRLKSILEEAADPTNNIIMFIDELHTIIGAGNAEGSADAANMLKPMLARGRIQLIGATTFEEYQKHIEKDPALKRRFQEMMVEEPTRDDGIEIIKGLREKFEDYHGVNITDEAIEGSIDMSVRYIMNKYLPDKAIDILDEACARKSTLNERLKNNDEYQQLEQELNDINQKKEKAIDNQDYFGAAEMKEKEEEIKQKMKNLRYENNMPKHLRPTVGYHDIGEVLSDQLGIPAEKVTKSEVQKLRDLDNILKTNILGQEEAVDGVVKAIRRNRLSVIERTKPIASFLFLGPSGVGKTYLAKLLADEFFGGESNLIRVDMSEYMESNSVSKLVGSAPGYVGYDEGGKLTEEVRKKPYSVVLFDEIEKASPDVLNVLLQIMDEGRVKDNKGRLIDFRNTIIILTSNIGSEQFGNKLPSIGFEADREDEDTGFEKVKERVKEDVKSYLAPEMINRLDQTVVFKPLSKEILQGIFNKKLKDFLDEWKQKENIKAPRYTKKNIENIIEEIHDPEYGARPLDRYIYENIEPQLIEQVMERKSKEEEKEEK